jgi:sialate O-acetylesterase
MVLQRETPVAVWGWASPQGLVAVSIAGHDAEVRAGADSTWRVLLPPLEAGGPHVLTIAGANTLTVSDVLVGEVWVASGQSNMEWPVARSRDSVVEVNAADYRDIRIYRVPHGVSYTPKADVQTEGWAEVTPETILPFSAVAYFFGRKLHAELEVPIGLLQTTWGGTPAEAWTSANGLKAIPDFLDRLAMVEARVARGDTSVTPMDTDGSDRPIPPQRQVTTLFNAMVAPIIPYSMRGVIWYQGEANASRAFQYRTLFPAMIDDWRHQWGLGDFPFLFVQLANFRSRQENPVEPETWPELREAQSQALSLPNTALAVTIDIGEADDIHPRNKQDVGLRLALAALGTVYEQDVVFSGPALREMTREGSSIRLHFDHVGGGLVADNGELRGFAIAANDRAFVWATAVIDGETVLVSAPEITSPVAVRYAWADNPVISLFNREGLPASPFRTDDWPGVTEREQ